MAVIPYPGLLFKQLQVSDVKKVPKKAVDEYLSMAGRKKQGISGLKETSGGKKRDDRQSLSKFYFEPISIDAENALTAIYMLRSPEGNVVLRAVASLERFGRKATENLKLLTSLGIFDSILPLVQHEDYLVKRFAQKLIAELCVLDEFRQQILADGNTASIFVTILEEEDDVVMHEFASLTLAELSSECFAAGKILQIEGCVDTLYLRLSSPDPDVQKNSLDTMVNLLKEIDGVQYFIASPHFDFKPILDLCTSAYPELQLTALNVIEQFVSWSMDNRILSAFRDSSGIEVIIGIVQNEVYTDLHLPALDILLKVVDNPAISEYLQQSGCLQILIGLLESYTNKSYIVKIVGILARVSQTDSGRKVLYANNMGQIFGKYLQNDWSDVQEPVCLGIASLALYPPALESIMSTNPIPYLLGILIDPTKSWKLREMSSHAFNILAHEDYRVAQALLDERKFEMLLPLLSKNKGIPCEIILNILQIFLGITASEKCRQEVISEKVVKSIMDLIQNDNDPQIKPARIQVVSMECLSSFMVEDVGRSLFHSLEGAKKLLGCLKNKYASVRQWGALLVIQMSQNLDFVKSFIRHQGLKWLLDRKEMRYSVPSWESAIEALFRAYLPAKFAFTGRLDLHDLTQEGFFILRRQTKLFFVLDDLLEIRASPAYPVYVANFETNNYCPSESQESISSDNDSNSKPKRPGTSNVKEDAKDVPRNTGRGSQKADDSSWDGSILSYDSYERRGTCSLQLESFGSCPRDPYLPEYLIKLRLKFLKEMTFSFRDSLWLGVHPRLIRQRAEILARFVADEMAGPIPDPVCKDHCLEMHINDVRFELETNIIPIGHIRVGSYLERAFLFKVLADQIGLPCAFVRGTYGRAWIEIAIPVININEGEEEKTQTNFTSQAQTSQRSSAASEERLSKLASKNPGQYACYGKEAKSEDFLFPPMNPTFSNALPTKLLKPNAIVDLVQEPGRILPINSYEADEYKGKGFERLLMETQAARMLMFGDYINAELIVRNMSKRSEKRSSVPRVNFKENTFERNFITAGRAVTEFLLKPSQLEGLSKTIRRSPYESEISIIVYNRKDVEQRALQVWGSPEKLEEELKKQEQVKKIFDQYVYETKRSLRDARRSAENTSALVEKSSRNKKQELIVALAVFIDLLNFGLKLTIWILTNSDSMLAEAIHSAADTLNESILVIGIIQSGQRATDRHPYGYTNMMYVASLISAVGILCLGAGVSSYKGLMSLIYVDDHKIIFSEIKWAFIVLAFSFVTESITLWYSLFLTLRSARKSHVNVFSYVSQGGDPGTSLVLMEDIVAALGSVTAAALLGVSWKLDTKIPDAVGSVIIGILLGAVAFFLIITNAAALIGRSIPKEKLQHINERIESDVMVRAIYDVKGIDMGKNLVRYKAEIDFDGTQLTRLYLDRMDLNDLLNEVKGIQGIDDLETFMVNHGEAIVDLLGGEIDRIELKIRSEFPEVRHMDLEIL